MKDTNNITDKKIFFENEYDELDKKIKLNKILFQKNYQKGLFSFLNPLHGKLAVTICNNLLIELTNLEKDIRNFLFNERVQLQADDPSVVEKQNIESILIDVENKIKLLSGYGSKLSVELSINNSKFAIVIAIISLLVTSLSFFFQN